ncbi:MAG: lamin tail domain-containing protein [Flavobacteriales bacterium]
MKKLLSILIICTCAYNCTAQIFVNEVMARNNFTIADEFGEFDDWIEIYNPTSEAVDLAGGYLTDDLGDLTAHLIESGSPALTTVPANGYLIFWADSSPEQGANHLSFSLSAGGESVALVLGDGETVANAIQFQDQENDISFGRETDGAIALQYFSIPTPNASNVDVTPDTELIHINEVVSENTSIIFDETGQYEPWIELYNPNDFQVNLAGYSIDYNNGESVYLIENTDPNTTVIEANNYKLFWCDAQSIEGLLHTPFTLASIGTIALIGPDGTTVHEISYTSPGEDSSVGSEEDGSDTYITFDIPTPNVTNQLEIVFPEILYINEFMASNLTDVTDNAGEYDDWIEIYNPNSYPVDLSGYHLSDNLGGDSWEIPSTYPDSVTVPAEGFLMFWADNDEEQGVRHTSFRLTSSGEDVILYSTDNFTMADYIDYPLQSEDVSYGREIDGGEPWVYFIPGETTPEASNSGTDNVTDTYRGEFSFYPNPVIHEVIFSDRVSTAEVYTLSGALVINEKNTRGLDLSSLESGVYFMTLDSVYSHLLVKE